MGDEVVVSESVSMGIGAEHGSNEDQEVSAEAAPVQEVPKAAVGQGGTS